MSMTFLRHFQCTQYSQHQTFPTTTLYLIFRNIMINISCPIYTLVFYQCEAIATVLQYRTAFFGVFLSFASMWIFGAHHDNLI
jgi:hypothetical protein